MRLLPAIMTTIALAAPAWAASYHWVDREGFHAVDRITEVPLAHRRDLPMARNRTSLPFTAEEDRDGAMYVWFMLCEAGGAPPYTKTADFPKSPFFRKVQEPRPADIAWWKGFVALSSGKGKLLTAKGEVSLKAMEKKRGAVTWYRFAGPLAGNPPPAAKAPPRALKAANDALLGLDGAATFPPLVKDSAELGPLRQKWEKAMADLDELRRKYPDDPQVLRLLGAGYRMGYNLGVPGAWERAEAYLLRTEQLLPDAPEAYISLGVLYDDTDPDYGALAERQFRTALKHARKEELPQIWWGLAVALYYQGKVKQAVATIDRLIALRPDDVSAKKLRETFLKGKGEER